MINMKTLCFLITEFIPEVQRSRTIGFNENTQTKTDTTDANVIVSGRNLQGQNICLITCFVIATLRHHHLWIFYLFYLIIPVVAKIQILKCDIRKCIILNKNKEADEDSQNRNANNLNLQLKVGTYDLCKYYSFYNSKATIVSCIKYTTHKLDTFVIFVCFRFTTELLL